MTISAGGVNIKRNRSIYSILILLTIFLGICSRQYSHKIAKLGRCLCGRYSLGTHGFSDDGMLIYIHYNKTCGNDIYFVFIHHRNQRVISCYMDRCDSENINWWAGFRFWIFVERFGLLFCRNYYSGIDR